MGVKIRIFLEWIQFKLQQDLQNLLEDLEPCCYGWSLLTSRLTLVIKPLLASVFVFEA